MALPQKPLSHTLSDSRVIYTFFSFSSLPVDKMYYGHMESGQGLRGFSKGNLHNLEGLLKICDSLSIFFLILFSNNWDHFEASGPNESRGLYSRVALTNCVPGVFSKLKKIQIPVSKL